MNKLELIRQARQSGYKGSYASLLKGVRMYEDGGKLESPTPKTLYDKDLKFSDVPALQERISTLDVEAGSVREKALNNAIDSVGTDSPSICWDTTGPNCIWTATTHYNKVNPNIKQVSGNMTFETDRKKGHLAQGFERVGQKDLLPGDIVQYGSTYPYHAVLKKDSDSVIDSPGRGPIRERPYFPSNFYAGYRYRGREIVDNKDVISQIVNSNYNPHPISRMTPLSTKGVKSYAYGGLIEEPKKRQFGADEFVQPATPVTDNIPSPPVVGNTPVVPEHPMASPYKQKEPPTISKYEETPKGVRSGREVMRDYVDFVEKGPEPYTTEWFGEGIRAQLDFMGNPLKALGNVVPGLGLPTNRNDLQYRRSINNSPFLSDSEKFKMLGSHAIDQTLSSLQNAALFELGALSKTLSSNPIIARTIESGAVTGLVADVIQLFRTDVDKVLDGDPKEVADLVMNVIGIVARTGGNFNTRDGLELAITDPKKFALTFKNLPTADKVDFFKDVAAHIENLYDQTDRVIEGSTKNTPLNQTHR